MIILIDAEKAMGQILHPFLIKTFNKPGMEDKFHNIEKKRKKKHL